MHTLQIERRHRQWTVDLSFSCYFKITVNIEVEDGYFFNAEYNIINKLITVKTVIKISNVVMLITSFFRIFKRIQEELS